MFWLCRSRFIGCAFAVCLVVGSEAYSQTTVTITSFNHEAHACAAIYGPVTSTLLGVQCNGYHGDPSGPLPQFDPPVPLWADASSDAQGNAWVAGEAAGGIPLLVTPAFDAWAGIYARYPSGVRVLDISATVEVGSITGSTGFPEVPLVQSAASVEAYVAAGSVCTGPTYQEALYDGPNILHLEDLGPGTYTFTVRTHCPDDSPVDGDVDLALLGSGYSSFLLHDVSASGAARLVSVAFTY